MITPIRHSTAVRYRIGSICIIKFADCIPITFLKTSMKYRRPMYSAMTHRPIIAPVACAPKKGYFGFIEYWVEPTEIPASHYRG